MIEGYWHCLKCGELSPDNENTCLNILCDGTKPTGRAKTGANSGLAILPSVDTAKTGNGGLLSLAEYLAQYKRSSKTEYERYRYLWACLQDGTITGLQCQPAFKLFTGIRPTANLLRPKPRKIQDIGYTADFEYMYRGIRVIEDVKGAYGNSLKNRKKGIVGDPIIGEDAKLRHKMLQCLYPDIVFKIVTDTSETIEVKSEAA